MCSDRVDSVVIGKAAQRRTPLHMRSLRGGTLKARSPNRATPHRGALALDESEFGIFSGDWLSGPRSDTAHGLEPRRRWAAMNAVSGRVRETEIVPQSTALSRSWSFSAVGKQGQTGKRPRKRGSLSSDRSLFRISDCTSCYPIAPAASRRDKSTKAQSRCSRTPLRLNPTALTWPGPPAVSPDPRSPRSAGAGRYGSQRGVRAHSGHIRFLFGEHD